MPRQILSRTYESDFLILQGLQTLSGRAIQKIADLTRKYSSRFHYKYPARGSMGHAWKLILGASYALLKKWLSLRSETNGEVALIEKQIERVLQAIFRLQSAAAELRLKLKREHLRMGEND